LFVCKKNLDGTSKHFFISDKFHGKCLFFLLEQFSLNQMKNAGHKSGCIWKSFIASKKTISKKTNFKKYHQLWMVITISKLSIQYRRPSLFAGLVFAVLTIPGHKPQWTRKNCHFKQNLVYFRLKTGVFVFAVENFPGT